MTRSSTAFKFEQNMLVF